LHEVLPEGEYMVPVTTTVAYLITTQLLFFFVLRSISLVKSM